MKKSISIVMMLLLAVLNISTIISNNAPSNSQSTIYQTTTISNSQLQNIEGGLPVVNIIACTSLLTACLAKTDGWWADILCIGLTGACLAL